MMRRAQKKKAGEAHAPAGEQMDGRKLTRGHERAQAAGPFGRPQLAQRFGFNLANPLTRDVELLSDLFQRVLALATDSEAHPDYLLLLGGKRFQDACGLVANVGFNYGIDRRTHPAILYEVAQRRLAVAADGGFE